MNDRAKMIRLGLLIIVGMFVIYYLAIWLYKGSLTINSTPSGAKVYIGNQEFAAPGKTRIKPGNYNIWVILPGYYSYEKKITVKLFAKNSLSATLIKDPNDPGVINDNVVPATPAIKNLPYSNDHFTVRWDGVLEKYVIAPNVTIGMSETQTLQEQMASQWSKYQQYAQEALAWMRTQGVTPTNDNIEWWEQDLWPAGKSITL